MIKFITSFVIQPLEGALVVKYPSTWFLMSACFELNQEIITLLE